MLDDIKTEDDKPVSPFLADGDKKQGDTAEERTEHPDPAQPAAYSESYVDLVNPQPPVDNDHVKEGSAPFTNDDIEASKPYGERENPVVTEGTTEVPNQPDPGYQFADPNDPIRQRYVEMERQKDEQIAELVKQGDGKPKI